MTSGSSVSRTWRDVLLLSAVAMALTGLSLGWPAGTLDEMILVVYPERMLGGDLPYRDFFAAYGPAQWWLLEGVFSLVGPSLMAARAIGAVVHVLLTLATYALVRPAGRGVGLAAGVITAALLFPLGAAPYAWVTCAALCLGQVALLQEARRPSVTALAGGLAGLAISFRPDVAPLALLPALVLIWGSPRVRSWTLGLAIGGLPLWVGLALTPGPLVEDIILGRAGRGAGQSMLPLWPGTTAGRPLVTILLIGILLTALLALRTRQRRHVAYAVMGVAALPQALQRADVVHFVYAGLLVLPLIPMVVLHLLRATALPAMISTRLAWVLAPLLLVLGTSGSTLVPLIDAIRGAGPTAVSVHHDGRSLLYSPGEANTARAVLAAIDRVARPGESLFIYDSNLVRPAINDVGLYHLLPSLRQRAHHMEITPGVTSLEGSGLATDVLNADVIVLVNPSESFRRRLFPYQRDGSREAQDALDTHFCQVDRVEYYLIMTRCSTR